MIAEGDTLVKVYYAFVYVFVHLVGLAKETKLQVGRENRSNEKH
jgi:hypothetical protein